jgi:nitrate reductase NapE component
MRNSKFFRYGKYVLFGILGIAAIAGFGFVVMWLWNWLIPELFGGPTLTYWQTVGLFILSKILFSGVGHRQSHEHKDKRHKDFWRKRFEEKMNNKANESTPEPAI